jgi:hypothetical protein
LVVTVCRPNSKILHLFIFSGAAETRPVLRPVPLLASEVGWQASAKQVGSSSIELMRTIAAGDHALREQPHNLPEKNLKSKVAEFLRTHREPWGRVNGLPSPQTLAREYFRQRGKRPKNQ